MMTLAPSIEPGVSRAIAFRHRLHQIPEIGYEEFETAAAIRAELEGVGIGFVPGVPDAPTATILGGAAFRTVSMDAHT